ncbi:hypothetical protein HPB47_002197, partial [Ixodes persulcatus]
GKQILDNATEYCEYSEDEAFCPKFITYKSQCTEKVTVGVPKNASRFCTTYTCDEAEYTRYNNDYRLAVHVVCFMTHLENDEWTKEVFQRTACYLEKKFRKKSPPTQKIDIAPIIEDLNHL